MFSTLLLLSLGVDGRTAFSGTVSSVGNVGPALGDIGKLFPDNDPAYAGADSVELLKHVCAAIDEAGYRVGNADCTVIAQRPKLAPYIELMRGMIASALDTDISCVGVKATTEEKLGFTGTGKGIAAHAVCLICRKED